MGRNEPLSQQSLNLSTGDIYQTTPSDKIVIEEAQLKVYLMEAEKNRYLSHSWSTPLGIAVSCGGAWASIPKQHELSLFGMDARTLFVLFTIGSVFWLLCVGLKSWRSDNKGTVDDILKKIHDEMHKQ